MKNPDLFIVLFQKYINNRCSPSEVDSLLLFLRNDNNKLLVNELIEQHFTKNQLEPANQELKDKLELRLQKIFIPQETTATIIDIKTGQKQLWKWTAAAVLLILVVSSWFLFVNKSVKQNVIVKTNVLPKDIAAPSITKATITLANGQTVLLDSISSGMLSKQGNVNVVKTADGEIVYSGNSDELTYNTLTNPRGSKAVSLLLIDGTKVWLNSESSIKYPTFFIGKERKVEIKGEVYFEVTKNAKRPFMVAVNDMNVEVLGTHFNISSYSDEASVKTTLLEGAIKITSGKNVQMLLPGQQANVNKNNQIQLNKNVDINEVMAWKNGKFQFDESANITTIMSQISRWYDIEVEYEGAIKGHIGGTISRDVNVSKVLEMLEMTGVVKFKTNGKKVIVIPIKNNAN